MGATRSGSADPGGTGAREQARGHGGSAQQCTSHRDDGVDITVGCPACDSYVCDAAVTNADYVTDRLEHGKNSKHAAACDAVGLRFVPAAFTTLGRRLGQDRP